MRVAVLISLLFLLVSSCKKDPAAEGQTRRQALSVVDGKSLWRTEVTSAPRDVSFMSDALVLSRGDWLLAAADKYLVLLRIPAP